MRRVLHLQHHRHTGKVIAHKHTSYRGLFILVSLFALVVILLYQAVRADEIITTAKVAAPIPTQPATITMPTAGNTVTSMPLILTGTCQYIDPVSVVELYDGAEFIGSSTCSTDDTYSIAVTLRAGPHRLLVRTVNITDDYGPNSSEIIITYSPSTNADAIDTAPDTTTGTSVIADQNEKASNGLLIRSEHTYLVYGPAKDAEWAGYFEGGVGPYKVTIDWGDGTSSSYSGVSSSLQTYRHHYDNYTTYFMTVTVTDSAGSSLRHQLAVVTPYIEPSTAAGSTTPASWFDTGKQLTAYIAYGTAAALAMLMVLILIHPVHPYLIPQSARPTKHRSLKRRV